jgi:hypothetical protein
MGTCAMQSPLPVREVTIGRAQTSFRTRLDGHLHDAEHPPRARDHDWTRAVRLPSSAASNLRLIVVHEAIKRVRLRML